jgi:hypothetical protein
MIMLGLFIIGEGLVLLTNWRNAAFTVTSRLFDPDRARRKRWRLQAQAWGALIAAMGTIAVAATAHAALSG